MTGDAPCVFLMGPTGGGKTRVALALAERIPCEIVSVDSAQVYRGLDRGTAKPNPAQRARVPHHLIDVCEPTASYSAAQFRADALAAMAAIRARGRLPLLVGGTGLYFRALEQGLADLPPADAQVRAALAAELARDGAHALHARLAALDAEAAARIHPNDPQRLLRALEIHAVSGRTRSDWWAEGRRDPLAVAAVKIILAPGDRAVLHARLATRFDQMLESGLVNEVAALRARGDLTPALPAVRCVGYREVWNYLDGDLSHDEMRNRAIIATRQLAKRQLTWLRGEQGSTWIESETADLAPRIMRLLHERGVLPNA